MFILDNKKRDELDRRYKMGIEDTKETTFICRGPCGERVAVIYMGREHNVCECCEGKGCYEKED